MYFTDIDDHQNFLVFAPMLSSLILDSNKNVTYRISTGISSEKIKPFDINLERTIIMTMLEMLKLGLGDGPTQGINDSTGAAEKKLY